MRDNIKAQTTNHAYKRITELKVYRIYTETLEKSMSKKCPITSNNFNKTSIFIYKSLMVVSRNTLVVDGFLWSVVHDIVRL